VYISAGGAHCALLYVLLPERCGYQLSRFTPFGSVRTVRRAGSIQRSRVRLSVCPTRPTHAADAGSLLLAGDIDQLLQQRQANAGSATLSAYIGS